MAECRCSLAAPVFINTSCASLITFVEDSRFSGGVQITVISVVGQYLLQGSLRSVLGAAALVRCVWR